MKALLLLGFAMFSVALTACKNDKAKDSSSSAPASDPAPATGDPSASDTNSGTATIAQVGTVALGTIAGELLPKEGIAASTVSGATIVAEGHPEITGTADAAGKFSIANVLPGEVALYIGSADGASLALTSGPSAYGLKIPSVLVKAGETNDLGKQTLKKTGGIKGNVVFYTNPNHLDVTGSDVFVPGTSFLAKTDASGAFALNGLPPGTYDLRLQHTGFAVLDLKAVDVSEGAVTDLGEVALSLSNGPEGSVSVNTPKISIQSIDKKVATSRDVNIDLSFDQDTALMKISDEPSFLNKEWQPVANTATWHFTSDGAKTIYVTYSDLNGLESSPFSDDVIVDTEAPVLTSAVIMNDWIASANPTVFLDVAASDTGSGIKEIRFKNESGTFTSGDAFLPFATHKNWLMDSNAGTRTVYTQVRDYAGNVSNVVSDQITRGPYTRIAQKAHGKTLVLEKEQSPFFFSPSGPSFDIVDDVELHEDVTMLLDDTKTLNFKGKVVATGSSGHEVTFKSLNNAACDGSVTFHLAVDGVSENNRLSFVKFTRLSSATFNGGTVENSKFAFDDTCTSGAYSAGYSGLNFKKGMEPLTFRNNTFDRWNTGMSMGTGATGLTMTDNNGLLFTLLEQLAPGATGTVVTGGTITQVPDATHDFINISTGTASISGLTYIGATTTHNFARLAGGTLNLASVTVSSCSRGVSIESGEKSTLIVTGTANAQSAFSGCSDGIYDNSGHDDTLSTVSYSEFHDMASHGLTAGSHGDITYQASTVYFTGTTVGRATDDSAMDPGVISTF